MQHDLTTQLVADRRSALLRAGEHHRLTTGRTRTAAPQQRRPLGWMSSAIHQLGRVRPTPARPASPSIVVGS